MDTVRGMFNDIILFTLIAFYNFLAVDYFVYRFSF